MEINNELMLEGYTYLENDEVVKACDCWLKLWEDIKEVGASNNIKAIEDMDEKVETPESLTNWVQDLEMELENAGIVENKYYEARINYCNEFCEVFPMTEEFIVMSMRTAVAESYFELGNEKESEKQFEEITKEYTDSVWPYVKWGDTYWLSAIKMGKVTIRDLIKAEEIYIKGSKISDEEDLDIVNERLNEVRKYLKK
ncbi:hypothetical protein [Oceanirhabdus sp. W0125-5]|uniref:hypothetical protein n=1 Tax=Oceanirhabdus sp. W0125-5 TaxID=2999116 RepID=UPI0022F31532|nr:hypothetical protein [Oceanirhabdus sp. W0125-5]WBW97392.1 hypothetical protein OW730_00630 [Oceanirhabdus sp. W0125-5]